MRSHYYKTGTSVDRKFKDCEFRSDEVVVYLSARAVTDLYEAGRLGARGFKKRLPVVFEALWCAFHESKLCVVDDGLRYDMPGVWAFFMSLYDACHLYKTTMLVVSCNLTNRNGIVEAADCVLRDVKNYCIDNPQRMQQAEEWSGIKLCD